ncbi:MAG: hypothetical protein SVT56_06490 [Chloroflexota bacterium]|nr:hypothetical protein [Chloroflexota bacterium]
MALEYHPGQEGPFIQNALVFAPGLTIIESHRELAEVDFSRILPPRLHKPFETTYKLTFTREGEQDIPVIRGSRYNLIVTNTEKIRIQKKSYRHHTWTELYAEHMQEEYSAEANLRLRAAASLPNLGSSPMKPTIPTARIWIPGSNVFARPWTIFTKTPISSQ